MSAAGRTYPAVTFEIAAEQVAAFARIALGRAQASLGHPSEGIVQIGQGLGELAKTETRNTTTQLLSWLAEAQALNDATTDAIATIEEALQANPEELSWRPDAIRIRGELRLRLGQTETAEGDFRDAIKLAQKIGAKAWELRAAMRLGRMLKKRGDLAEAGEIVAPLYSSFTEGFDTPDLKDAKALLDELSR